MSDERLRRALREIQIPEPDGAEERGRQLVEAAYAERESTRGRAFTSITGKSSAAPRRHVNGGAGRRRLARSTLAVSLAALLAVLLLSPAGAAVRDWVDEAISNGAPDPEPTLARVPGGGKLLVQTGEGPVVVQPDGSRRLLGDFEGATWSPHGLFVAAVKKRTLSALEPDGSLRWSLASPERVAVPRWSPSGERIAYFSGFDLRVVAGDGSEDRLLAGSASGTPPDGSVSPAYVPPAWDPSGGDALAYVTGAGRLRILDSETGAVLAGAPALHKITWMDWAAGGHKILEASPGALRLRPVLPAGHPSRAALGKAHSLPLPPGAKVNDTALAPERSVVAASVTFWKKHGTYSEVIVYRPGKGPQTLLSVPGSLWQVEWSPDGKRLLVAWPGADQWLFLPLGRGKGNAIAHISRTIAPSGRPTSFPELEGWCCPGP